MSDVLLTIERNDDKRERFIKSQECFQAGAKYNEPKIEVIEVPCGDEVYEGYFCHHLETQKPRNGQQFYSLEAPMLLPRKSILAGSELCERGYAMLLVDTPRTRLLNVR
ncbi:MAG: hypothetical protein ACJ0HT_06225 [Alphaproteobacteria bacterium]